MDPRPPLEGTMEDTAALAAHDQETLLDGNAVAGILVDVFGYEMTDAPCQCAHCGHEGAVGALVAYTRAPGVVLRCRICTRVVLRVVVTPRGRYVDASGVAALRLPAVR